jgi:hypothetical protein
MLGLIFDSGRGQIAAAAALFVAFMGWFAWDQRAQERHKIEARSNAAVSIADKAGAHSRNRGAGGVRDPFTVD